MFQGIGIEERPSVVRFYVYLARKYTMFTCGSFLAILS